MTAFRQILRGPDRKPLLDEQGRVRRIDTWTFKFGHAGKSYWGHGFATKALAEEAERAARRAVQMGFIAEMKAIVAPRSVRVPALSDIFKLYRQMPPGGRRANADTREGNIRRLRDLLTTAGHAEPDKAPVTALTARLVYDFKLATEQEAAAETEERRFQLYRAANSTLRQAISVFAKEFCEYYRLVGELELPESLQGFRTAPPFKGCKKFEYNPPTDTVVAATFKSLEAVEATDKNLFKAAWLALGFGLRKSEISVARNSWFMTIGGSPYIAGDMLAKNRKFPHVRAQLGAWDKLKPHIEGKPANDYVVTGADTERNEDVFRRISSWMRSLGWATQHHVHELRAFAGCQVAMHSPKHLYDAQTFLRHASVATTENAYGHHLKRHMEEVQLTLPTPAPFVPTVIDGGAR